MIDSEFALCDLADDLLLLTLDMCDRDGKNPRTPKRIHRSLADRIVLTASAIEETTILANETPPSQQRAAYQQEAMRRCVVLRHQARILADKGYISQKQLERWQKLTTSMYWRLRAWAKADAKR